MATLNFVQTSAIGLSLMMGGSLGQGLAIAAPAPFGTPGRDGIDGRDGRDGRDGENQTIQATDQFQRIDLSGGEGEPGEDGIAGEYASDCRAPRSPAHDLVGADGGNGGRGGQGGQGGNGGRATVLYDSPLDLANLQLLTQGGVGGLGGAAGQAGQGCQTREDIWVVDYCTWEEQARERKVDGATWESRDSRHIPCDLESDWHGDDSHHPKPRRKSRKWEYRWENQGYSYSRSYSAFAGDDGRRGTEGQAGEPGTTGEVYLVAGDRIPWEQREYSASLQIAGLQPVELVRNNWLEQVGLRSRLAAGSQVNDSYFELETLRDRFSVVWQADKSPTQLDNPELQASLSQTGQLSFELPGHVEYETQKRTDGVTQVTVLDGIEPERLGQMKFNGFNQFTDAQNFSFVDQGQVGDELSEMIFAVRVWDAKLPESEVEQQFNFVPNRASSPSIERLGDIYKLSLGKGFDVLMQPGTNLKYQLEITQVAPGGGRYLSEMQVQQTAGEVTFQSPQP